MFNEFKAKYLRTIKHSVAMVTGHMNSNLQENSFKIQQISMMTRYKNPFNLFLALIVVAVLETHSEVTCPIISRV